MKTVSFLQVLWKLTVQKKPVMFLFDDFFGGDGIYTDSAVFRLHYITTKAILLLSFTVVGLLQCFGDPIDCTAKNNKTMNFLDTLCGSQPRFFLPKVSPSMGQLENENSNVSYPKYYDWIIAYLFCQAVIIGAPRCIWKVLEGDLVKQLVAGFQTSNSKQNVKIRTRTLVNNLISILKTHNKYVAYYMFCETLNIVFNSVQIILMDYLSDYQLSNYSFLLYNNFSISAAQHLEPLKKLIPKVIECAIDNYDTLKFYYQNVLCVLPLNAINEAIFIFFWFWYQLLTLISILHLVYYFLQLSMPCFRACVLRKKYCDIPPNSCRILYYSCTYSDLFVLNLIKKNVSAVDFNKILQKFCKRMAHINNPYEQLYY